MIAIALTFAVLWLMSGPAFAVFLYIHLRREHKWNDFYEYMESEK